MYQFSRGIYRELAPLVAERGQGEAQEAHAELLRACERTVERLAFDRHYFARPTRTLFSDVRRFFPIAAQCRVYRVIERYLSCADEFLSRQPRMGFDVHGNPLQCRATTRKGTPCQRIPLPHNGYCPSHQHLAETEQLEPVMAA